MSGCSHRARNRQNGNLRATEYRTVPEYLNPLCAHEQVSWCTQECVGTVDCVEVTEVRWACLMEALHLNEHYMTLAYKELILRAGMKLVVKLLPSWHKVLSSAFSIIERKLMCK